MWRWAADDALRHVRNGRNPKNANSKWSSKSCELDGPIENVQYSEEFLTISDDNNGPTFGLPTVPDFWWWQSWNSQASRTERHVRNKFSLILLHQFTSAWNDPKHKKCIQLWNTSINNKYNHECTGFTLLGTWRGPLCYWYFYTMVRNYKGPMKVNFNIYNFNNEQFYVFFRT